jgi:anti-sigma-K factor RskA
MSEVFSPEEERDFTAAEYVLGLLEREELLGARGRLANDPAFAADVEAWERRFAPMHEAGGDVAPPPELWSRIERALGEEGSTDAGGDVVALRRRERLWKGYGAGMTALAAGLALVLGLRVAQPEAPAPQPQAPVQAPVLVAALASEAGDATFAVSVSPDRGSLLVTPARVAPAPGHSHELWLIQASGTPVSLGVLSPDAPRRHTIPAQLLGEMRADAALAVSVEPTGGSTTGAPTGPVIASAPLRQI